MKSTKDALRMFTDALARERHPLDKTMVQMENLLMCISAQPAEVRSLILGSGALIYYKDYIVQALDFLEGLETKISQAPPGQVGTITTKAGLRLSTFDDMVNTVRYYIEG